MFCLISPNADKNGKTQKCKTILTTTNLDSNLNQ